MRGRKGAGEASRQRPADAGEQVLEALCRGRTWGLIRRYRKALQGVGQGDNDLDLVLENQSSCPEENRLWGVGRWGRGKEEAGNLTGGYHSQAGGASQPRTGWQRRRRCREEGQTGPRVQDDATD